MVWLTLALKWCVKNWRVCALLAFLAAVVAAQLYLRHKWRERGRSEERALWDASIARGKEEIARIDRENAAAEATAKAEGEAIGEKRRRDLQDTIETRDRTIARLRTGELRLRKQWVGCLSAAGARQAAAMPSGSVPEDELRATGAADLVRIGQDADSRHARLVEFVQVQQKLCEAIQ